MIRVDFNGEFFASCYVALAQQGGPTTSISELKKKAHEVAPPNSYPGTFSDFYGLPTNPISVYKSGDPWRVPRGPQAQRILREARPVCNHPIRDVWPELGKEIYTFLDSLQVKWSTIDLVRFAEEREEAGLLHLWVGVIPKSLSLEGAKAAASGCKKILADAHILDIEIAFRESVFTRSTGPQLLNDVYFLDPTAVVRVPLTPALGVRIAPQNTPHFEGTGALYLRESGQSNHRVLLLTARHVVLPPPIHDNQPYVRKFPRQKVLILGSKAYTDTLEDMMAEIARKGLSIERYETQIEALGDAAEGEDARVARARQAFQENLAKAEETIKAVDELHSDTTKRWSTPGQRVLGHVLHAPPISVGTGPKQFTEDWALIELDHDKINWDEFKGNAVSLGKLSVVDFVMKMNPRPEDRDSFEFPIGGLWKLKGILTEDEIRFPKQLDANGEECLIVFKHGKTTGATIGRGTNLESFVREYDDHGGIKGTSVEIAIYPFSHRDHEFSAPGDSGSIVVDRLGRIVGMLTGGTGTAERHDVTYLTPYFWLDERIKEAFPEFQLY